MRRPGRQSSCSSGAGSRMRPHPRRPVRCSVAPDRSGRRPRPLTFASVVDPSLGGQDFPANPPVRIYEPYASLRLGARDPAHLTRTHPGSVSGAQFAGPCSPRPAASPPPAPPPVSRPCSPASQVLRGWLTPDGRASRPCRSSPSPRRPAQTPSHPRDPAGRGIVDADGRPSALPVLAHGDSAQAQVLRPRRVRRPLALTRPTMLPSAQLYGVGTPER
jgi:hypothetical protein